MYRVGMFITLWVLFTLPSYAFTTVPIEVLDDGKVEQTGIATLVANETIIINHKLLAQGNQYVVTDPTSKAKLIADLSAKDESLDLAILHVNGLSGNPVVVAKENSAIGSKIYLVKLNGLSTAGTLHSILPVNKSHPEQRWQHTVLLTEGEFGAPLVNNCQELLGVSVSDTKGVFDKRLKLSSSFSAATNLTTLKAFLTKYNIDFTESENSCLSEADQLAALEEEKKKQQATLEKQEAERKAVEEELEKLKKEAEAKKKALEVAKADTTRQDAERQKAEEALEEARQQTIEQQKKLEDAEKAIKEQEEKVKETEAKSKQKEQEFEEEKKSEQQKLIYYAIPIILVLIVVLIVLSRRRKKLLEVEQEASENKQQLSAEKAKVASAQEALSMASATFDDIILDGKDEAGGEHRIKVIGSTLARTEGGILIGRSAQKANYVINVPGVSREHLNVILIDNKVMIEDLSSVNGTAINDKDLAPNTKAELKNGDTLRIGTVTFSVHFLPS